ncbi:MAG: 2-polyprenyl-3-methyl-6-methoxy-1,4-benzoquinone monooxygenase, partial [Proteobacteria bacterium]|nr:2-polyprenyl-3-methyl-6-methoxy-1,4-benzoquinone monooxygenase [Pseudomonadota bacterium]
MNKRSYSIIDRALIQFQNGLNSLYTEPCSQRPNPSVGIKEPLLTANERRLSSELMRVNHTGEICAQALYYSQMAVTQNKLVEATLAKAAEEETDHLAWTGERLKELGTHPSYLNFFWYTQAYLIGLIAGLSGDGKSLGFVEETERQVSRHLQKHLKQLPANDVKSRAIIQQMRTDEQRHGQNAVLAGATSLPLIIKLIMSFQAKIMTITAA